jgi:deazaflavin-dependent oxidoreductase (nitroreductase family)
MSTLPEIEPTLAATDPTAMRDFNQLLIAEFRACGGALSGQFTGAPVLLLTTIGARSAKQVTVPVMYVRDGSGYVVIASKSGAPTNPAWYYNLVANPLARVEIGTESFTVEAREVQGQERDRLFEVAADNLPMFAEYQRRTARRIPVMLLKRTVDSRRDSNPLAGPKLTGVEAQPDGR